MSEDLRTLLERMPWRGLFTKAQVAIFDARRARLVDAMTDAVGLFGQQMYTDPAHIELLATHVAMAGDFFDDGHGKFIEYRLRDSEAKTGDGRVIVFEQIREWRKCGDFDDSDPPPAPPDAGAAADAAMEQINTQLPPDVRRELIKRLAAQYTAATKEGA